LPRGRFIELTTIETTLTGVNEDVATLQDDRLPLIIGIIGSLLGTGALVLVVLLYLMKRSTSP